MIDSIYVKARRLAESGRVELLAETANALYLVVDGDTDRHDVRLSSDHSFSCTCPWGSLKGAARGALCSHVAAAVIFLSSFSDNP